MIKIEEGKKSLEVRKDKYGNPLWSFCENGYQSTGVYVSKELFQMMRELTTNPMVVELYESLDNEVKA